MIRVCYSRQSALTLALVVLVLTSACTLLSGCTTSGIRSVQTGGSVYDRVIKQGKIRCGYVIYSPGCFKDPNTGKMTGIGIETTEMLAKNLGLKVEWVEEVGWGTMIEGLQTDRYDMVATPIWTNSTRARQVDFSKSLYYSPIYAWVKAGDKRFNADDLSALNNPKYTIGTVDGETAEVIANEDFPLAKKVSLPQLSGVEQLLLNVSTGKADISFEEPAVAQEFLAHNPGSISCLSRTKPLRVFPNCWMFKRGQIEFKDMIDTALEQLINSGVEEKILHKYEKYPGTLFRNVLPYQIPAAQ